MNKALLSVLLFAFSFFAAPLSRADEAIFAGGCFWCMEPPFEKLEGVSSVISGYTGGHLENPSYEQVSTHKTGHYEAVKISFDPKKITYDRLLEIYWQNIDPTNPEGQFCDRGESYRTAIFYLNAEQRLRAESSAKVIALSAALKGKTLMTKILPAKKFYVAEDYHQDYYKKNPEKYKAYRLGCQRDKRLRELWGDGK